MTPGEIIYHRRVRVLEHAAKTDVAKACRVFGVSRTTFYRWKKVAADERQRHVGDRDVHRGGQGAKAQHDHRECAPTGRDVGRILDVVVMQPAGVLHRSSAPNRGYAAPSVNGSFLPENAVETRRPEPRLTGLDVGAGATGARWCSASDAA